MGREWPLVGRDDEAALVRTGLDAGRHVVVAGAAGAGKTRLVAEVVAGFAASGVLTRRVAGTPSATNLPLAPFAALLDGASGWEALPALIAALGADKRPGPGDPVLHVDDVHLLDDASASLLHHLGLDRRVRLALTMRSGEPLPASVAALLRDASVERLSLGPLSDDALTELLVSALGGPLDGATLRRLVDVCAGNVLYLRELTESAVNGGMLEQQAGLWRFTRALVADPLLEELIVARLAPLSQQERDVVELLALAGRLNLDTLAQLTEPDVLEALERQQLITTRSDGTAVEVEPSHPLYGEMVRARLPRIARLRHCRRLAEVVEALPAPTASDELQATLWRFESGAAVEPDRLFRAAQLALNAGDTALASRLGLAACDTSPTLNAALLTSWCLGEQGDHHRALAVLERARAAAADPWLVAALGLRAAEQRLWGFADTEGAAAGLRDAATGLPPGPWHDLLTAQRAVFDMLDGRVATAWADVEPLLTHDEAAVRAVASIAAANALAQLDRGAEGATLAAHTYEDLSERRPMLFGDPAIHLIAQATCLTFAGELERSAQLTDRLYRGALLLPSRQARAWAATARGQCALERGQLVDALRDLTEAELLWEDSLLEGIARRAASGVVLAAAQQGDLAMSAEALARLDRLNPAGFSAYEPSAGRARAWVRHLSGDSEAAHAELRAVADDATARALVTQAVLALTDLARLGAASLAVDAFAAFGPLSGAAAERQRFVTAVAGDDGEGLDAAADGFEARGALVLAAEAAALAAGAHRRAGRGRQAELAATRSRALAGRCQALDTPALRDPGAASPLSSREREVAELAAAGRTNRQIAQRLVVSERTVENHLYRVFAKLGISSRDDLTSALRP